MDMGVFEVGEVPDPITVHLQSRCPPNHPEIQFDDPDNMFDISEPYRLQNQWYFDLSIDPVSAGSWEAQVLINDISLIELITLQVFATVIEEDD